MATATAAAKKRDVKEFSFNWVGQDKSGKTVRGEMRASGEAQVNATLRRQGIKLKFNPLAEVAGVCVLAQRDSDLDSADAGEDVGESLTLGGQTVEEVLHRTDDVAGFA